MMEFDYGAQGEGCLFLKEGFGYRLLDLMRNAGEVGYWMFANES